MKKVLVLFILLSLVGCSKNREVPDEISRNVMKNTFNEHIKINEALVTAENRIRRGK